MEKTPTVSASFICIQPQIPQKINHRTDLKNLVLSCFNLDCLSSIYLDLWAPYESSYFLLDPTVAQSINCDGAVIDMC